MNHSLNLHKNYLADLFRKRINWLRGFFACWCILSFMVLLTPEISFGQSCSIPASNVKTRSASTNFNKFGYVNPCLTDIPQTYYLQRILNQSGMTAQSGDEVLQFYYVEQDKYDFDSASPGTSDCSWTAPDSISCMGKAKDEDVDGNLHEANCDTCTWVSTDPMDPYDWGRVFRTEWVLGDNSGGNFSWVESTTNSETECSTTEYSTEAVPDTGPSFGRYKSQQIFGDEFTHARLIGGLVERLPKHLPSTWSKGDAAYTTVDDLDVCAHGAEMEYQMQVPDSQPRTRYNLTWYEITTSIDFDGNLESYYEIRQETIIGTGDPVTPAQGKINPVAPPALPEGIAEVSVYETEPTISVVQMALAGGGGSGGGFGR
jgi:hypothetical protein